MLGQTVLSLSFRDFGPSDYVRLAEISNANYPDSPVGAAEMRHNDESRDKSKHHLKRYACVAQSPGMVVGFGRIAHAWFNFHPQKFIVDILVDPPYQGRGVGSRMYEMMSSELERLDAKTAWASVKEDLPKSLAFAGNRGFVEKKRMWESRLNPLEIDSARFQQYVDGAAGKGIRISTLAEEVKSPDALQRLYELDQDCSQDVPFPTPYTRISYEEWEAKVLKSPGHIPEAYIIASDGPRYVGYSILWQTETEPKTLWQIMTGVRREYRGRGIAIALKLRGVDFARRNHYDKIITYNHSDNAPMLGINTKLGFKRQIGWITMEKNLERT